jgi:serine/threonine-protein kinase
MKVCPNCQTKYPEDSNFCPQETCATPEGPRRLEIISEAPSVGARYEMEGQIGGRRSGEVFRARDQQTGATVAYKRVTRAVLTSPAVVERSQRELKQLQRAQSPRLAKILDFGKEPDGQLFVVSELADGQTLAQVVAASGPFSLERAKKIAAQIGEALLEGQKVGVVHHDLAPKNVLVGAGDQVKVINFVAPVPVTETVFGVPEYLSPEQAEGKLVDQRSNTYSLGGILLFMLTGQPPVEGASAGAVLEQVMKGSPVPPSLRVQGLNAEIDRVIGKAMDKSPNRRPLTIRQFLTDVAGMMAVAPQTADPARGVGFAKTMMFTGGSPEAQKLVNQALAARAEANGTGAPPPGAAGPNATAPIAMVASEARGANDSQATPPPVARPTGAGAATAEGPGPRRTHGAAIAATMVALPAAGKIPGAVTGQNDLDSGAQPTPPPVAPAPTAAAAAGAGGPAKTTGAAAFRETLWFKQGDVDQMVADARAKLDASRAKSAPGAPASAPVPEPEAVIAAVEAKPLEDRYRDDGTVSVDDRKKYSLRSGATSTSLPTVGGAVPGERMSAEEMMGEIGGGKRTVIIIAAVAVVLAVVVGMYLAFRGKHVAQSAAALTPVAVPTQPTPPPPPPAPPAPAPAAAAPPPAAAAPADAPAAAADDEAPKAHAPAAKKHAAKKAKGKKHH